MDILEAIQNRHSVRNYEDRPISTELVKELSSEIENCNKESGLNIQFFTEEPEGFKSILAYGSFKNVKNYIGLVGEKSEGLEEACGYYGERVVLKAQQLGLNTCWVAATFNKKKCKCVVNENEKLVCVISIGYGENQGKEHKSKMMEDVCNLNEKEMPEWFEKGMEAALLAPTAINQQKFLFTLLDNNDVNAEITGGFNSKVDLGIAKYHFEIAAGKENFKWKE